MKNKSKAIKSIFFLTLFLFTFSAGAQSPARDYFARMKYDVTGAVALLKGASGQPLSSSPQAEAFLEDMGYWKTTRAPGNFEFTPELEQQVRAQFAYLQKAYTYEAGDTVWVKAKDSSEAVYGLGRLNHRALIKNHINKNGTDYYLVDVLVDGPTQMETRQGVLYDGRPGKILYYKDTYKLHAESRVYTKTELDQFNSPASSFEQDNVGEQIDWKTDKIWLEKMESFKQKIAASDFSIDWTSSPAVIYQKQTELLRDIFRHFKMNRNAPSQSGRGLGLRSSGGGVCYDQALVLSFAIQGVGQTLGLKAFNLDGTTVNPVGGHGFVRVDLKTKPQSLTYETVIPYDDWINNKDAVKKALDTAFTVDNPMQVLSKFATHLNYEGYHLQSSTMSLISDPGWADFGVTPDMFSRMPVMIALNPLPVDSNRAVNGLSKQRNLSEVAASLNAQGPMRGAPQAVKQLTDSERQQQLSEFEKLGGALQCSQVMM